MHAKGLKVVQRMFNRALVEVLERWQDCIFGEKKLKAKIRKVVHRLMNRALVSALGMWSDKAKYLSALKRKYSRTVARLLFTMLGSSFSTWASETKRIVQTRSVVRQILEEASNRQAGAEDEIARLQTELAACNASLYELQVNVQVATVHGEQMEKREKVIMDEVQELSRKFRKEKEEVQRNLQELTVKASVLEEEKKNLKEEMEHVRRSESDRRERARERAREREEQAAEREREIEEERVAALERISIERMEMEREISQARVTERRLRESLAEAWKELKDRKEDWDDSKVMSLTWSLGLCLCLRLCVSFLRHCGCAGARHVVVDVVRT